MNSRSVSDAFMIDKYLAVAPILTLLKPNALMLLIRYSLTGQTAFYPFHIGSRPSVKRKKAVWPARLTNLC